MSSQLSQIFSDAKKLASNNDQGLDDFLLGAATRAQRYWAERLPWPDLERRERFAAPGDRQIVFPARAYALLTLVDVTNNFEIERGGHFEDNQDFVNKTGGHAFHWRPYGITPVAPQPQTDTALTIQAGASESMQVFVQGLVRDTSQSGTALELYEAQETVTLSDENSVDTANNYVEVFAVEKPYNTENNVTVTNKQDGKVIARIPHWDTQIRYPRIETDLAIPAGTTLEALFLAHPQDITGTGQPLHPSVDEDFMVWRLCGDLHWIKNNQQAARLAWGKADEVVENAKMKRRAGGGTIPTAPTLDYLNFSDSNPYWF